MFDKMFDEMDAVGNYPDEFLAKGQYESDPDEIISGFKIFQKMYVYGNVIIQLILVIIAIGTQIMSIYYDKSGNIQFNVMLITFCAVIGFSVVTKPINTRRNLEKAIENLRGTIYETEIYADRIKISTIYDAPVENGEKDTETKADEEKSGDRDGDEDEDEIPATLIHLDNSGVEITETDNIYIVYVKKVNIFVIPKSAFTEEDIKNIRDRLEPLMGVRFKEY